MARTVFFSWQSDTPNRVGRNFLRDVLETACGDIAADASLEEAARDVLVDSDTLGVPGQPPIVDTIFKKIDAASVFVADLTFVGNRTKGMPTPNPNVLIEYGWALKALGYERIVCVMNTAFGEPSRDNLPFDLSHVRWPILYALPESASTEIKKKQKKALAAALGKAVRASLASVPSPGQTNLPKFPAAQAKDGPGRFRASGEPLGFDEDSPSRTNKDVFLSQGPSMWLRLMPASDSGQRWTAYELKKVALETNLLPILNGSGGYGYLRAADGVGIYRALPNDKDARQDILETPSVAFVFETGEMWSVDSALLTFTDTTLPFLENYFVESIKGSEKFLKHLGVLPPYRWAAGIAGVKGRHLEYPLRPGYVRFGPGPICAADSIESEGRYEEGQTATAALTPFFDKIFSQCGFPRPDYLNEQSRG